jgi:hypothetical protein
LPDQGKSVVGLMRLLVLSAALTCVAFAQPAPAARLRPTTPRLAALIEEATARSPTFRKMVASLESTDGMVFIDEGRCARGANACLTFQLTQAGRHRLLFVFIDLRRPDVDLMASIGHELRHALEVLADPSVRTTAALKDLYLRDTRTEFPPRLIETAAARWAGDAVRREIQQSRSRPPADVRGVR